MSSVIHCAFEGSLISWLNTAASMIMAHNIHACFECVLIPQTFSLLNIGVMILQQIFFAVVSIVNSCFTCADLSFIIMFVDVTTISVLHLSSSDALISSKSWKCYHIDKFKNNCFQYIIYL